jgi:hypothetical protein
MNILTLTNFGTDQFDMQNTKNRKEVLYTLYIYKTPFVEGS